MGIMDIFSNKPPVEKQPQGNQQPQQPQGNQQVPPGGSSQLEQRPQNQNTDPNNPNPQNQNTPENKLDAFQGIWDNEPASGDGGKSQPKSYLDFDRKALKEKAKTLDFARTLDPALVGKALSGDQAAFAQIINQTVQGAFVLAMDGSLSFAEKGFGNAESRFFERLPSELKKHTAFDQSLATNPKMNHKAVRPLVGLVQSQLQAKFPDASTSEIQQMTQQYFSEFMSAVNTPSEDNPDKLKQSLQRSEGTDWDEIMGLKPRS